MKILVVQETDWILRGPHQSHHLFERLSASGHEVKVIDFGIDWNIKRKGNRIISKRKIMRPTPLVKKKSSITVIRPSFIMLKGLDLFSIGFTQFFEILRQIRKFKPDIVISFGIVSGFSSLVLCHFYKTPFCEYWIDVLHELIPISKLQVLGLTLEKVTIKKCDTFIAINERLLKYGKRFNPSHSKLIRAGVDLDSFSKKNEKRNIIRERFNVQNDECLLYFMGFLYDFSGLINVIESILDKKSRFSKFKLLIVGEGDQKKALKTLIKKNKIQHRVFLLEWQPYKGIPALISASDICLLPAHRNRIMNDIVPIKMYEYLALEKPVVTTALCGIMKEFGKTNGVIYAKTSDHVMDKCEYIFKNDLMEEIGKKGRKFIELNCDWNKITLKFLQTLQYQTDKYKHDESKISV